MSEIRDFPSVERWFDSAGHTDSPPETQDGMISLLSEFCAFTGRTPDELVAGCFLRKKATGDKFISAKARQEMNEAIVEFVSGQGLVGRDALAAGNVLRGFLIHNGVFIQGGAWRGSES